MIVRDGHVSNSSSSSFISVMTKDTFEKAKAKTCKLGQQLADMRSQHKRLGNEDIVLIAMTAWDGMWFDESELPEPEVVRSRGCSHEVSGDFCSQCGRPKWVEEEQSIRWRDAWDEFVENIPKGEEFGHIDGEC